ncbi:NAD(P)H:quinone oxidoreductase [Canna indica]|uniref:NAD(P)H:quinone oxidoreductase n=1 Tax=Canna indica TaxID=4628 RepID=A0AAQ3K532_9LILI|nr:NAD(P)H:quinone oxidoreductase [Canna indica]
MASITAVAAAATAPAALGVSEILGTRLGGSVVIRSAPAASAGSSRIIALFSKKAPPPPPKSKRIAISTANEELAQVQSHFLLPRLQLLPFLHLISKWKHSSPRKDKAPGCLFSKPESSHLEKLTSMLQFATILAAVDAPSAMAVTGENMGDDLVTTLLAGGFMAVLYLFVFPPIIMNWLRLRWYKRKFFETYLQFMCVFIFFPGLMLWAPFLNFRKFPRDPTMENPWSTPKDDVPLYKSR